MKKKMVLTNSGDCSASGCMIPVSDSSNVTFSSGESYRRFDNNNILLSQPQSRNSPLTTRECNIPPQPLLPAPLPPRQAQEKLLNYQGFPSTMSHHVNSGAKNGGGGESSSPFGSLSNNNPFLPLIQASTNFFTQKLQSFQSSSFSGGSQHNNQTVAVPTIQQTAQKPNQKPKIDKDQIDATVKRGVEESAISSVSASSAPNNVGMRSMGEILFSSPPASSLPVHINPVASRQETGLVKTIGVKDAHASALSDAEHNLPVGGERSEQLENREESTSSSVKPSSESTFPTSYNKASEFHHQPHHNSPTRIRDRQRKMELTLQQIQHNQEERMSTKKHHNLDSHYPTSTPYSPKLSGGDGQSRYRSPHRSPVPPLKESDEFGLTENVEPSSSQSTSSAPPSMVQQELPKLSDLMIRGRSDLTCNKWILESMREEIRIENERMEDATKSLMMEDDFVGRKSNGVSDKAVESLKSLDNPPIKNEDLEKLNNTKEKLLSTAALEDSSHSYANSNGKSKSGRVNYSFPNETTTFRLDKPPEKPKSILNGGQMLGFQNNGEYFPNNGGCATGIGGIGAIGRPNLGERAHSYSSPITPPILATPPFRNTRSFSIRQDSAGSEGSDSGSPDGSSLPSLQRAMSCDSVSSDTSVGVADLYPPHPTGYLCVGLEYDCETADLLVNVMEAKELVGPDSNNATVFDSYVRVYLLPDKTTNMQTRVYRKSLNPVYREKFMFGVETIELPLRTLVFYLYATDKYSNTLVGEAEVKLGDLDIYQPITTWLQLTDTGQRVGEVAGEIMFSLSYLPTAERLTVVVVKARNLMFLHDGTGDPFVKVYLLQKGKKVSKKKSSTKRGEKNPIFNEAMIFSVPAHALQTIQLRITVADSSGGEGRATSIGHVIVGSSASGKPLCHWNQMLSSLRKPIAMWHQLRK